MNSARAAPPIAAGIAWAARAWDATWSFLASAVASFSNAVMVSAILHVLVIFGVTHPTINPKLFENPNPPLEVTLVNAKSKEKPLKADVLAQHDLVGGGTVEDNRVAKSPLPAAEHDQTMSAEAEFNARVQALEAQTQALMRQLKSDYKVPQPPPAPVAEARPPSPTPAPVSLTAKSLEMATLRASIDSQLDAYQKRPRRDEYGVTAKGYTFAQYVDDWRTKVERVGNMNYPEAARRNSLYGSLILYVYINADGTLESVEIVRSSGKKILDAAAIKIVEMAAPYAPFTESMRKQTDILGISRTWIFTRSDQLTSQ